MLQLLSTLVFILFNFFLHLFCFILFWVVCFFVVCLFLFLQQVLIGLKLTKKAKLGGQCRDPPAITAPSLLGLQRYTTALSDWFGGLCLFAFLSFLPLSSGESSLGLYDNSQVRTLLTELSAVYK